MTARRGVTLVELVVVIVLLSVVAAVGGISARRARPIQVADAAVSRVLAARDSALASGRMVTVLVRIAGQQTSATAYPDGRLLADPRLGIDPFSGRVKHVTP